MGARRCGAPTALRQALPAVAGAGSFTTLSVQGQDRACGEKGHTDIETLRQHVSGVSG